MTPSIEFNKQMFNAGEIVHLVLRQAVNASSTANAAIQRAFFNSPKDAVSLVGEAVEITAGDSQNSPKFNGYVESVEVSEDLVRFTAVSNTYQLNAIRRSRSYSDTTFVEVVRELLSQYGINANITADAGKPQAHIAQIQESDADFLQRLCLLAGFFTYEDGKSLLVADALSPGTKTTLDQDMLEEGTVGVKVSAATPANEVLYRDYLRDEVVKESASPTFKTANSYTKAAIEGAKVFDSNLKSSFQASVNPGNALFVEAESRTRSDNSEMVEVTLQTRVDQLKVGNEVMSNHELIEDGLAISELVAEYTPDTGLIFSCVLIPIDMFGSKPVSPQTNQGSGWVTATVIENEDPEMLGRVRVKYPWHDENGSHWLRVSQVAAGKDHGTLWIPEIDDEVICCYDWMKEGQSVVLGSLYHGKALPEIESPAGLDEIVLFKTSGGSAMRLLSKGKNNEQLMLSLNDGKVQVMLSASDSGDVAIKTAKGCLSLEGDTVTIKSKNRLALTSDGEVSVKSAGKVALTGSQGNLDVE